MKISSVKIQNYKSIRSADLSFNAINILIGSNGVGKSNLISYFKFLNNIINNNLSLYVNTNGGADSFLYFGSKESPYLSSTITFDNAGYRNWYRFELRPTNDDVFVFQYEYVGFEGDYAEKEEFVGKGYLETRLFEHKKANRGRYGGGGIADYVTMAFNDFRVYHFHDTSDSSAVKKKCDVDDNRFLRPDASNLAAFLYQMQKNNSTFYNKIEATVKIIAPFFQKFNLRPSEVRPNEIRLEWLENGSDKYFNAYSLSDGTLRMMCLATLLLQPNPPQTIIIDEPELGLHPMAIQILASLIKTAAQKSQIIISTQSVTLINQFSPENIIVVDRQGRQSTFRHIDAHELEGWKEEYALGEIWEKNLIGGRP